MIEILGVPFSAHTRKVIVAALEKEMPYELVPLVPLDPPKDFAQLNPLGKIPVLREGQHVVVDSSVICHYLERRQLAPSIYPAEPQAFARALWLEEFVDGALAQHVLGDLLLQRVFAPAFLGVAPDEQRIEHALGEVIPARLAYLEAQVDGEFLAGGSFSIADVTVASLLLNFYYAGEVLDPTRYPRLLRYLRGILTRRCFARALEQELPAAAQVPGLAHASVRELMAG